MKKPRSRTPLTPEQEADAARLKAAFLRFQAANEGVTQDTVGAACGMNQSAASQYINGKIALNIDALLSFAAHFNVHPKSISPSLTAKIAAALGPELVAPEVTEADPARAQELLQELADLLLPKKT